MPRALPLLRPGSADGVAGIMNDASPLITAITPGPLPRYGRCVTSRPPAMVRSNSTARCCELPCPGVA